MEGKQANNNIDLEIKFNTTTKYVFKYHSNESGTYREHINIFEII